MTIKHHLSDNLLMAYSAGELPEAFNLVIATHVSLCDECRARLATFDTVGGAVLESCDTAPVSASSLDDTMRLIGQRKPEVKATTQAQRHCGIFPTPLRDYVDGDLDAVRWRNMGNGLRQAILPSSKEASARLLYIPAGMAVPDHGHRGTELTLVLSGAFTDENDRFARGDIEIATEEMEHTPIAEPGEPCICLAATDAPLRFNSLIPRLAQPFLRI